LHVMDLPHSARAFYESLGFEATGEVVRAGGKTIFVAGIVTADGTPVLRFNAIIRKVRGSR